MPPPGDTQKAVFIAGFVLNKHLHQKLHLSTRKSKFVMLIERHLMPMRKYLQG